MTPKGWYALKQLLAKELKCILFIIIVDETE